MTSLSDRKITEYVKLNDMLSMLQRRLHEAHSIDSMDTKQMSAFFDTDIRELSDLCKIIEQAQGVRVEPTEAGYQITMIAPEAKNSDDPINDVLQLNTVVDIFWWSDIVYKAIMKIIFD